MIIGNFKSYTPRAMVLSQSQWIRAYGGALPCCNNSEKDCLEFWKNKNEKGKMCENGKMYMKNNGTYFDLNKWNFCTTVYSSFCTVN